MRVLLFSPISIKRNGGAELYLTHLADALQRYGHETKCLTGLPFHSFARWHWPSGATHERLARAFSWADGVYCSYGYAGYDWTLTELARKTNTPIIAGHHAPLLHADKLHTLWMQTGGRFLLHRFTAHHVLLRDHGVMLKRWGMRRVVFVPCGVDRQMFQPGNRTRPHRKLRFLFVGRRDPQKGVDILEEAVREMTREEIEKMMVRVILANDFNVIPASEARPESFQDRFQASWNDKTSRNDNNIGYLGNVPHQEIPKHMHWSDVVLVPSREETSPAVVLEALAAGRPVLGSDIPAIRAFVVQKKTGFLVSPGSPQALRKGMLSVISSLSRHPGQWSRMSIAARKASEKYDHDVLFEKLIAWMEKVVSS